MLSQPALSIEIWSDVVCPFCYIGKRQLEVALERFAGRSRVTIEWKSFLLDPEYKPHHGESVIESLARRKKLRIEESRLLHQKLTESARDWGLDYRFETMISVNSQAAHRLLQVAKTVGQGAQVKEALMRAYFTECLDLGDRKSLFLVGQSAGLAPELMDSAWTDSSGGWGQKVFAEASEAHALGTTGVPFFVFQRQYSLTGAQGPERFLQVLEKIERENSGSTEAGR